MEQQLQANRVTCILTSCGRFDLLRITLDSFFKYNTYDVAEFIIYDDSGLPIPQDLTDTYPFIQWYCGMEPIGQIEALDFLWGKVKTEYCFAQEDDWEFLKEGFIENSMKVLQANQKIFMVWLNGLESNNSHPIDWELTNTGYGITDVHYGIFKRNIHLWAWHRFNPSLKRKSNYDLIAPFSKHTTFNKNKGWKSEEAISKVYNDLGFTAAILPDRYIKHIGEDRRCV